MVIGIVSCRSHSGGDNAVIGIVSCRSHSGGDNAVIGIVSCRSHSGGDNVTIGKDSIFPYLLKSRSTPVPLRTQLGVKQV